MLRWYLKYQDVLFPVFSAGYLYLVWEDIWEFWTATKLGAPAICVEDFLPESWQDFLPALIMTLVMIVLFYLGLSGKRKIVRAVRGVAFVGVFLLLFSSVETGSPLTGVDAMIAKIFWGVQTMNVLLLFAAALLGFGLALAFKFKEQARQFGTCMLLTANAFFWVQLFYFSKAVRGYLYTSELAGVGFICTLVEIMLEATTDEAFVDEDGNPDHWAALQDKINRKVMLVGIVLVLFYVAALSFYVMTKGWVAAC
jgi:hypothetical protein